MKKIIFTMACYLIIIIQVEAQSCDLFYDDFSNASLWTPVGTDVLVNNNQAEFQNGATDGEQRRIYRPIGTTLNSNDKWRADLDFYVTSTPTEATGHNPISLTAGTQEPFNDCPDIICSGYPVGTQDGVFVTYVTTSPTEADRGFVIKAREGSSSMEFTSSKINALATNTTYYLTLERLSASQVSLGVYSDPSRTIPLLGSPVSLTIPTTIDGINTIQVNNNARGNTNRQLNGWVDNICLSMDIVSPVENKYAEKNIKLFPNPSSHGLVNIQIENPLGQKMEVRIFDSLGKYIWKSELIESISNWNKEIKIEGKGIYFVIVRMGDNIYNKRLIIVD